MIISASRRTDIPAFYAEWWMRRIRAGYCTVPNPFNLQQVARISLRPEDVDAIVFWTRNPRPLFPHLAELDRLGYRYYFQFTLMDNPRTIDRQSPPLPAGIRTFRELASRIGPERVIWRYDPIVIGTATLPAWHSAVHAHIAGQLAGCTLRNVISIVDIYRKAQKRLAALAQQGVTVDEIGPGAAPADVEAMLRDMAATAHEHGMRIASCAEQVEMAACGIEAGKCVDDSLLASLFGLNVSAAKDPSQREACGCVTSKDVGMYDSCLFECQYCYATSNFDRARENYQERHMPDSPSLLGWYE